MLCLQTSYPWERAFILKPEPVVDPSCLTILLFSTRFSIFIVANTDFWLTFAFRLPRLLPEPNYTLITSLVFHLLVAYCLTSLCLQTVKTPASSWLYSCLFLVCLLLCYSLIGHFHRPWSGASSRNVFQGSLGVWDYFHQREIWWRLSTIGGPMSLARVLYCNTIYLEKWMFTFQSEC